MNHINAYVEAIKDDLQLHCILLRVSNTPQVTETSLDKETL